MVVKKLKDIHTPLLKVLVKAVKFDELTPAEQDMRMFANSRLGTSWVKKDSLVKMDDTST